MAMMIKNQNKQKPFNKEGQEREVKVSFVIDDISLANVVKSLGKNSVLNTSKEKPLIKAKRFYREEYKVDHIKKEAWKLLFENYDCDFNKFVCLGGTKVFVEGTGKLRYEGREEVDYDEAVDFIRKSKTEEEIDVTIRQRIEPDQSA